MLVYVHILLMVFWLGTDIGVFAAGLRFIDPQRSIAERNAVISLGMVIDRYPRICFVAIVPVGLQMSYAEGLLPLTAPLMGVVWILSALWLLVVIAGMIQFGKPQVRRWHLLERGFHLSGLLLFAATGLAGLMGQLRMPGWLAGKLVAYGGICLFALLLDRSFAPVFGAFGAVVADGSTPTREARLRRYMLQSYVWVLAIYAAVLLCGYLGTVKP